MYEQAIRVDPNFALALARLAGEQATQRLLTNSFSSWRKAVDALSARHVTRREELRIRGMHAMETEDFAAAEALLHNFTLAYPHDSMAHHYRALALRNLARFADARDELLASERLHADELTLLNLVVTALVLCDNSAARSYLEKISASAARDYYGGLERFLAGDYAASESALFRASKSNNRRIASLAMGARAAMLAELGREGDALAALADGIVAEAHTGNTTGQARKLLAQAHLRLIAGQHREARSAALEATRCDGDTHVLQRAAVMLAKTGFPADARSVRARLNSPDEGRRMETAQAVADGFISLAEGHQNEAQAALARAGQLAAPIHPRDFLAQGLEWGGRSEEALTAWRRIARNPSLIWHFEPDLYDPGIWSESLLRVAALSLRAGNTSEGRASLNEFLNLRRHADPNSQQSILAHKLLELSAQ
jgi:hypothetical protein